MRFESLSLISLPPRGSILNRNINLKITCVSSKPEVISLTSTPDKKELLPEEIPTILESVDLSQNKLSFDDEEKSRFLNALKKALESSGENNPTASILRLSLSKERRFHIPSHTYKSHNYDQFVTKQEKDNKKANFFIIILPDIIEEEIANSE